MRHLFKTNQNRCIVGRYAARGFVRLLHNSAPMGVELDRRVTEIMRERRGWLARSTVEEERVGIAARYNPEHLSPSTTPPKP